MSGRFLVDVSKDGVYAADRPSDVVRDSLNILKKIVLDRARLFVIQIVRGSYCLFLKHCDGQNPSMTNTNLKL